MPFAVLLTNDTARDLNELYDYIAGHDSSRKADYVLEKIRLICYRRQYFPEFYLVINSFFLPQTIQDAR